MPTMSRFEGAVCRSRPWRVLAREVVLPWSLQGFDPVGDVLEIGAGSGAVAAELLARSPDVTMTVTDVDEAMVEVAAARLAGFGERVAVRQADATALPFSDGCCTTPSTGSRCLPSRCVCCDRAVTCSATTWCRPRRFACCTGPRARPSA